jgi:hypothetical protein
MFSQRNLLLSILFVGFAITLMLAIFEITGIPSFLLKYSSNNPRMEHSEDFDSEYKRLNSMHKLEKYVDSIYATLKSNKKDSSIYPEILVRVIRRRFYHSYSYYGIGDNYMSLLISPLIYGSSLNAIVNPDDILEKPFASCSQQVNVFMTLLRNKGYKYRHVIFDSGTKQYGNHYTCEIWFNEKWNYFDPDMELRISMVDFKAERPDVKTMVADTALLQSLYGNWKRAKINALFAHYKTGKINASIATNAALYHTCTQFLSLVMWQFFLLAFQLVRLRKKMLIVKSCQQFYP